MIDIVFNGLLEILILNYMVPMSIAPSALYLKDKLDKLIDDISTNTKEVSDNQFSITDWFYVSSFTAKKRPDVPESSIVLKYRTTNSVNISKKFNSLSGKRDDHQDEVVVVQSSNIFTKAIFLCGASVSLLLKSLNMATSYIGGLPEVVQMILIRCIQPALLTCVATFGVQYPQMWVIVAVLAFLVIYILSGSKVSSPSKVTPAVQIDKIIPDKDAFEEKAALVIVSEEKKDDKPVVVTPSNLNNLYTTKTNGAESSSISSSGSSSGSSSSSSTDDGSITPAQTPPKAVTPPKPQDSVVSKPVAPPPRRSSTTQMITPDNLASNSSVQPMMTQNNVVSNSSIQQMMAQDNLASKFSVQPTTITPSLQQSQASPRRPSIQQGNVVSKSSVQQVMGQDSVVSKPVAPPPRRSSVQQDNVVSNSSVQPTTIAPSLQQSQASPRRPSIQKVPPKPGASAPRPNSDFSNFNSFNQVYQQDSESSYESDSDSSDSDES